MKKIEKRLKEYRIRFRDTERIEKKAYPFEEWEMSTDLEEESFEPSIDEKQILFDALARKGLKWNPDTLQIEEISKVGDWGVFYDREENLKDRLRNNSVGRIGVLGRIRRGAREYIFREFDGLGWKNFHKIDPSKPLLEIIDQLKKEFNIE